MLAAIAAHRVRPMFLVQAQFASGSIYVWSGLGTISWNGQEWLGLGTLGAIGTLPETAALQAQGITLTLSSIPSDLLGDVLNEIEHGLPATVWFGALDDDNNVIANPYAAFAGRIDAAKLNDDGQTATALISVESRLIDMSRVNERRYTLEDQQIDYPGDLGFEYVPLVQTWAGAWGNV